MTAHWPTASSLSTPLPPICRRPVLRRRSRGRPLPPTRWVSRLSKVDRYIAALLRTPPASLRRTGRREVVTYHHAGSRADGSHWSGQHVVDQHGGLWPRGRHHHRHRAESDPQSDHSPGATGNTGPTGSGYGGTSTTSLLIANLVTKVFATQTGLAYQVGNYIRASSAANGANFMEG